MLQIRERALNGLFDIMPVSRGLQDVAQGSAVNEEVVVSLAIMPTSRPPSGWRG